MTQGPSAVGPADPASTSAERRRLRLLLVGNPESVHVRRWAAAFVERGHDVHIGGLWAHRAADGDAPAEVHRLGRPLTSALALRGLARRLGADVVHAHYLTHYGWITWASGARPYVLTLWGSDILLDPVSTTRRLWARVALGGAALVTADSADVIAKAVSLGASRARVREIQFGVDTSRFHPGPSPLPLAERLGVVGKRVIFSPRALTELYRVRIVVEALAELDQDAVLVATLAGSDPAYVDLLTRDVAKLGLDDRVRIVPSIPHEEIDDMYRLADVVVSVPASDGTPVSVLEAMSSGRPVVATDLPSVRPWLAAIRPDLLVPVDDPGATARALDAALSTPDEVRERDATAARSVILARADEQREMDKVESAYLALARR